jgi:hypothetical protein
VPVTLTALDAPDTTVRDGDESAALARLAPPVVAALTGDGAGAARPGDTEDARYLVSWHDPLGLGAAGFGMFLELERHGIDVGVAPDAVQAPAVRAHRTLDPGQADAEIHIAAGDEDIERWRRRGDARELAALDARSAEERAEVRRLKAGIAEALRRAGREDLVARLDAARISLVDETLPDEVNLQLARLAEIDDPLAVFLDSAP